MPESELARPIVTLAEAQAYLRIETGEEEALLAGLIRSASALCEAFTGSVMIARSFLVEVPASSRWERLPVAPVRTISSVVAVHSGGIEWALATGSFAVDIDASGIGWVQTVDPEDATRLRVSGEAGLATGQNGVPEPIRLGVLRLIAHLFGARDSADGEPPAAVTALWRPYRRVGLA